jgi:hypothetical protein
MISLHAAAEMASVQHLGRFVIPTLEDTGVSLGRGAYGEVVEMRMKGEKVAVKKLHPVFKDTDGWDITLRNFEEECVRCVATDCLVLPCGLD